MTSVAFHHHNKWVVTGSEDGTIKIWDMRARGPQRDYTHKCPVNDVQVHPNQGELVSCDQNGSVKIWDLGGNQCTHELVPEEDAPMRSVSIATDGSLLCAGNNRGNVYVWKMMATKSSALYQTNNATQTTNITASPDDMTWDLQPVTKIQAHSNYLLRCLLSPDVKHLATCSADSTIKMWNISSPNNTSVTTPVKSANPTEIKFQLERTLVGHQRWVWDCAFSADSEYLVSAASDHTARLWDLGTGETIRQYQGHHKAAVCVALNDYSL